MKKLKQLDKNYLFIIVFCSTLVYLVIPENSIFGANIDWISQHVVFPEYFRELFYQTKNIFPNFALQIGAGQNIFNFSYYGLYNPLIMISYLLPMISMKTYIIGLNMFLFNLLGIITYYFFKSKTSSKISLITTLLLITAAPILFQFHKHFMFVNYLPFLMLGMIGVDKFFKNNNKSLIAFSVFMIITISYYYSIPSILVLCVYAVYKYIKENEKIIPREIIKKGLSFCIPIIIAIVSSCILLLPTYYVLKTGRTSSTDSIELIYKLLPKFNLSAVVYDNYAIGLTFISLLAFICGFMSKKKEIKFLTYTLSVVFFIPIFIYILNGNLYFRNKVLIPFIPLFGIFLIDFFEDLFSKKIDVLKITIITIMTLIVCLALKFKYLAIYADALIVLAIITAYKKNLTNEYLLVAVLLFIPLTTVYISNNPTSYMNEKENDKVDSYKMYIEIDKAIKDEQDLVRFNNFENKLESVNQVYDLKYNQNSVYSSISNPLYKSFYENTFNNAISYRNNMVLSQNNDILFQTFMGVKYIYSKKSAPIGYTEVSKNVYENDNVLPMLYGTSKTTNESEFDKLSYPNNITKLLNSVVVKYGITTDSKATAIKKINLEYDVVEEKNIRVEEKDTYKEVKVSGKSGYMNLKLKEPLDNDVLIINVSLLKRQSCKKGDLRITINDINNVLTCKEWMYKNSNKTFHYVISKNTDISNLRISLNPGTYKISDIEVYKLNYKDLENVKDQLYEFNYDKKESNGDVISGSINMKNNGYFATTIPYDKGFKVLVDGKKTQTEKINKSFLGFKLNSGEHEIKIIYKAPLQKEGMILSIIGIVSFIILLIYEHKNKKVITWKKSKSFMKKLKI